MSRENKSDEIKEYLTRLNRIGARGISSLDQQRLTALLIQGAPSTELPTINELDIHHGIPVMIASYIENPNTDTAFMLADYIRNLYVDFFKQTVEILIESSSKHV